MTKSRKKPSKLNVNAAVATLKRRAPQISAIAQKYVQQQRLGDTYGNGGGLIHSTIFSACLDYINRDSREEARKQLARAAAIEQALKVLGVTDVPHSGYVHPDRMTREELLAIDPHFRSLVRGLSGDLDAIRPITSMKQMVIDLHEWSAHLKRLRKDRAFFFYLGKRFADAKLKPPVKTHTLEIYRILCEAVKEAWGTSLPAWPLRDYDKARTAINQGSKATAT